MAYYTQYYSRPCTHIHRFMSSYDIFILKYFIKPSIDGHTDIPDYWLLILNSWSRRREHIIICIS